MNVGTMNQNIDAVIFDLDGTLWDPTSVCLLAWERAIASVDYVREPITAERLKDVFGVRFDLIGPILFPSLGSEAREDIMARCLAEEKALIAERGGDLYAGVEAMLEDLERDYRLYIVSNCQSGYIESFFSYHGLGSRFLDFECAGNTGKSKHDNIRLVVERNGLKRPVYVGDTEGDEESAAMNGIPFVFASYGFGRAKNPDLSIGSPGDLVTALRNNPG